MSKFAPRPQVCKKIINGCINAPISAMMISLIATSMPWYSPIQTLPKPPLPISCFISICMLGMTRMPNCTSWSIFAKISPWLVYSRIFLLSLCFKSGYAIYNLMLLLSSEFKQKHGQFRNRTDFVGSKSYQHFARS